jgi:hypothetical protein
MEETFTIDQIRDEIIKFKNDNDFQMLESFYYSKSFSEILEISRRENSHSGFIAWLLNNTESHNLGDFSIKKFLDIILKFSNEKLKNNSEIYNSFVTESYHIERVYIEREKSINKVGRLDIYVELTLLVSDKKQNIKLIIENKVESKENNDQTNNYFNHFNPLLKDDEIIIYVYLTPISTLKLKELKEPECGCKEFIQINYQSIVDYLIEPALNQNISNRTKNIITEYLKSLSQPSINDEIEGHKQELIMALGNEERKLLTSFWNKNQKLILAALYAISSDPDQEEYTRNTVQDALSGLQSTGKDYTKYIFNGQTYAKSRLVLAVIQDYVIRNPITTYNELQQIFPNILQGQETFTTATIAKQKPSIRNFIKDDELINLSDEQIAVSTQWGRGNIEGFVDYCIGIGININTAQ